jgi:DNA-directed RNA polymerase specialized sigma24 family protein
MPLLRRIERLLHFPGEDLDAAEEVASHVWFALARDAAKVLRGYDPTRAALATFLVALARHQVQEWRRSRSRRPVTNCRAAARVEVEDDPLLPGGVLWEEFFASLSPTEQDFLRGHLSGGDPAVKGPLSDRQRKMKQRLIAKLRSFIQGDGNLLPRRCR